MTLFSLSSLFAPPEDMVSRDRFGGPVLRQPAAHSPHSRLNVVFTCGIPPHTVLLLYVGANYPCCCCSRITYLRTGELCTPCLWLLRLQYNRPLTAAAFRTTDAAAVLALYCRFLKKNLNASRPSEHPSGIIGCEDKRAPMVVLHWVNSLIVARFSFK